MARLTPNQWARAVMAYPSIPRVFTGADRSFLLALAIDMRQDMFISIPRTAMAARFGVSTRTVDNWIFAATNVGFLRRSSRGHNGRTAEFYAQVPRRDHVPEVKGKPMDEPAKQALDRWKKRAARFAEDPAKGADGGTLRGTGVRTSGALTEGSVSAHAQASSAKHGVRATSRDDYTDMVRATSPSSANHGVRANSKSDTGSCSRLTQVGRTEKPAGDDDARPDCTTAVGEVGAPGRGAHEAAGPYPATDQARVDGEYPAWVDAAFEERREDVAPTPMQAAAAADWGIVKGQDVVDDPSPNATGGRAA